MSARKSFGAGAAVAAALGATVSVARLAESTRTSMGGGAAGERLRRMQSSPQWRDGRFHNTAATSSAPVDPGSVLQRYRDSKGLRKPAVDVPLVRTLTPPTGPEPRVTWFGHASALLELDGARVLLDPVWSDRCSPSQKVGPKRLHAMPVPLTALGHLDAVVISHDHYDHLDMDSVVELAARTTADFVVPLGIGAHLERWGVAPDRIVECDWEESHSVAGLTLTCVESQHFSGRGFSRDGTLWGSWVVAGPSGRVFFSGDTGYFDGYPRIAATHGPFDLALMAVGMYDPAWRPIHLDPEEAVAATVELGSPLLLPIHWCTFTLAPHPWAEPIERMVAAAEAASVRFAVPRPGEPVTGAGLPAFDPWWRAG
jgi:L-ascorbate metabolism protein UlaG (beta-lactamase superfamily)